MDSPQVCVPEVAPDQGNVLELGSPEVGVREIDPIET